MASTGPEKWDKYFAGETEVKTTIKTKLGQQAKILDNELKKVLYYADNGEEITVLGKAEYNPYYSVKYNENCGRLAQRYVAKPIYNSLKLTTLSRKSAIDFCKLGEKSTIFFQNQLIETIKFSSKKLLQKSILIELEEINQDITKTFQDCFKTNSISFIWPNICQKEKSIYGVYLGELLIGLYAEKIFNETIKEFHVPIKCQFSGIDSFLVSEKTIYPVSSKFGYGARASFFTNILPYGMNEYKTYKKSIFKDICEKTNVLNSAREIVYSYGINHILNINIEDHNEIYQKLISKKFSDDQIKLLIKTIKNYQFTEELVRNNLPFSTTAFFNREIARQLNDCPTSKQQILDILSKRNYWQISLDKRKWMNGKIKFKTNQTTMTDILIAGNKSGVLDLTSKQGYINYELKQQKRNFKE